MSSLAAACLGFGALAACAPGEATPTAESVEADYYVSEYGVRVGIQVAFDEQRTVTGATLTSGDDRVDASLYPLDGTDPDAPTEVSLAPGVEVSVEGTVLTACPATTTGPPEFEVVSRVDGAERTERYAVDDIAAYERAVAEWCDRSLTMWATGSRETPTGERALYVAFSNPGPDAATVTSSVVEQCGVTWDPSTVQVRPGTIGEMTIEGQGRALPGCIVDAPWVSGHIRADGEIIQPGGVKATVTAQ